VKINFSILDNFKPVKLQDMDNVSLLNRVDTKYVLNTKHIDELLKELSKDYFVLEINGKRHCKYQTLYYDTPDSDMFTTHVRGKLNRFKVRKRVYVESGDTFLEVKFKNNKERTIKWRTREVYDEKSNGQKNINAKFLSQHIPYDPENLIPMLKNRFIRITLVDYKFTHRATIDVNLAFDKYSRKETQEYEMPDVAIVELKTDRSTEKNGIHHALREIGVFPNGFSKYCMGRVFIEPDIEKSNALKPKVLKIKKIKVC
jgi:hypothetical protein